MEKNTNIMLDKKQDAIRFFKFTVFSATAGIIQAVSSTLLKEIFKFIILLW